MKLKIVMVALMLVSIISASSFVLAKSSEDIIFKDKNLFKALCDYYSWNRAVTKEKASDLSNTNDYVLVLDNANISDLEGLQYFDNLAVIYLRGNNLNNLKSLSKIKSLISIDFSNNSIKGSNFMKTLKEMGKNYELEGVRINANGITNINVLNDIGSITKYYEISMENNKIKDISILEKAISLGILDLSNNRISDVTPLKDLKELHYIDLRDNCIIDYKPIKHLLDAMHADVGYETGLERYDYYKNPVNFTYHGKTVQFPYLTVYYKYQAYAEAIPLFKALGGSAKYNKKTGTLTCEYNGNVLIMKDFSKKVTLNGEKITLGYPMRRMQYDLAYIPVKDVCEILGLNYDVVETRKIPHDFQYVEYAPKVVEISEE